MNVERVKLSKIAAINPPLKDRPSARDVVSFLGMADVNGEGGTTSRGESRPFSEVAKGYTHFVDRDLLVAKITPCFENGKIAQAVLKHPRGAGSTEFHVIRPDPALVDERFLLRYLRQPWIRVAGEQRMTGSVGQRRVPEAFLTDLTIPLPSLQEQRRIAQLLDQVDAVRGLRRNSISLLDDLIKSIFLDMFGDPISDRRGWCRRRLGDLGSVLTGNTPPRAQSANYGDQVEWIKSDNIAGAELFLTEASERLSKVGAQKGRLVGPGALLVTCIAGSSSSIGNVAIADREVAFNQQINSFSPRDGNTFFYYFLLRLAKPLVAEKSTGGMKGLVSKSRFESILLIDPPHELKEQFSHRAESVVALRKAQCAHLAKLDELFSSVQRQAFPR